MKVAVPVPGVPDQEFPDDASPEDIQSAINSMPQVQAHFAQQTAPTSSIGKVLTDTLGPVNKFIKDNNFLGLETSKNLSHETVKGIPVLGALTPEDTDENKQFQEDHPVVSSAAPIAAGVASTAPLAAGAEALAAGKSAYTLGAEYAPKSFEAVKDTISPLMNALRSGGAQATLGGGLNAADAAAKGDSTEDIRNKALLGTIGGAASPVVSKIISPGLNIGDKVAKSLSAIAGAVGGHSLFGNDGILGLLLGEAPIAADAIKKVVANKLVQTPGNKSILDALINQGSKNAPPGIANAVVPNGD